jgi:hypothetical protein
MEVIGTVTVLPAFAPHRDDARALAGGGDRRLERLAVDGSRTTSYRPRGLLQGVGVVALEHDDLIGTVLAQTLEHARLRAAATTRPAPSSLAAWTPI